MSQEKPTVVHVPVQGKKFAIVAARFNADICDELIAGAKRALEQAGVASGQIGVFRCPGAFEIPGYTARILETGNWDAAICLGAVVRGDTPHFDFVAGECASGLMQVGLASSRPVIFGVLTTNTMEQAWKRAARDQDDKGGESAHAAMEMVHLYSQLS